MTQPEDQNPVIPPECAEATELVETDKLKLHLLNRDIDYYGTQVQMHQAQVDLNQIRMQSAVAQLNAASTALTVKYGLKDPRQVDVATGKLNRELTFPPIPEGGGDGA